MEFSVLIALFGASLAVVIGLFSLRAIEAHRGGRFFVAWRYALDSWAQQLKRRLVLLRRSLKRFPALSFLIVRYFIHIGAKSFARLARRMEEGAYHIADRVSHKHRFQRRKSNSKFLHEVASHKNGLDTRGLDE